MLGIKPNVSILNPRTALSRKYKHGLSKPISMFIKTIHLPNFSLKRSCRISWQHFAMLLRWYFPRIIIMHLFIIWYLHLVLQCTQWTFFSTVTNCLQEVFMRSIWSYNTRFDLHVSWGLCSSLCKCLKTHYPPAKQTNVRKMLRIN